MINRRFQRGFSILEAIIAIAIFMLVATAVIGIFVVGMQGSKQGVEYVAAAGLLQEGTEAVRSIRNRDFSSLTAGTYGLDTSSGYYELAGTSDAIGEFTRTITIEDVNRNPQFSITPGGSNDPNTKRITVNVTWETLTDKVQNIDHVFYIHNFTVVSNWIQDLISEFNLGSRHDTRVQAAGDGEIVLQTYDASWSSVSVDVELDLNGNGDRVALYYDAQTDILYALAHNSSGEEFEAIDVSDISQSTPTVLNGFELGGANGGDVIVKDGYAFLATTDDSAEVMVVDVVSMTSVNTVDLPGTADATGVALAGTTLVISRDASTDAELYFYDVSDPEGALTEIGATEIGANLTDVEAGGGYAYASSDNNASEVYAVRISDQAQVSAADLSGLGDARSLALVGSSLYVGRTQDGLNPTFMKLDVSVPETALSVAESLDTSSAVQDVAVDAGEETAFLATGDASAELTIVDLASFTQVASGDAGGGVPAHSVEVVGSRAYIGTEDETRDMSVFVGDASSWDTPELVGFADLLASGAASMDVDGSFAYIGTQEDAAADELFIYDISTPSSPTYLGSFDVGAGVNDLDASGNYVYLASSDNARELDIIDVTTKSSPSRMGSYDMQSTRDALAIEVVGTTVYVGRAQQSGGSQRHEFWVIDASSPASPSVTGSMDYSAAVNDLVVDGSEVYAATSNNSAELLVIDISTPSSPSSIGTLNLVGNADGVAIDIDGDTVVLGRDNVASGDELVLIDVATPGSPSEIGSGNAAEAINALWIDSSVVYAGSSAAAAEFQYWDVSTPASPSMDGSFNLGGAGTGVYFDGTYVYLSTVNASNELQILGPSASYADYVSNGTFTSQAFDSGSSTTSWSSLSWTQTGTGSAEFRVRTASTQAGLSGAAWVGSDGTVATSYSASGTSIVTDPGATGTQWIQWKVILSGSGASTPVIEDVSLEYVQ